MHSKPFKATKTTHMPLKSYAKPGKPTQRNCWLGGIHHSSQPLSTTTSKEKKAKKPYVGSINLSRQPLSQYNNIEGKEFKKNISPI